jgi:hypothetical protein
MTRSTIPELIMASSFLLRPLCFRRHYGWGFLERCCPRPGS